MKEVYLASVAPLKGMEVALSKGFYQSFSHPFHPWREQSVGGSVQPGSSTLVHSAYTEGLFGAAHSTQGSST